MSRCWDPHPQPWIMAPEGPTGKPLQLETQSASVCPSFLPLCPTGCQALNTPRPTWKPTWQPASALLGPLTTPHPILSGAMLAQLEQEPGAWLCLHLLQGAQVGQDWHLLDLSSSFPPILLGSAQPSHTLWGFYDHETDMCQFHLLGPQAWRQGPRYSYEASALAQP